MSYERKQIAIFGAVLVLLTVLFPPWVRDTHNGILPRVEAVGYSFIGDPPPGTRLDVARLTFQFLGLITVFGVWVAVTTGAAREADGAPRAQSSAHIVRVRDSQ